MSTLSRASALGLLDSHNRVPPGRISFRTLGSPDGFRDLNSRAGGPMGTTRSNGCRLRPSTNSSLPCRHGHCSQLALQGPVRHLLGGHSSPGWLVCPLTVS